MSLPLPGQPCAQPEIPEIPISIRDWLWRWRQQHWSFYLLGFYLQSGLPKSGTDTIIYTSPRYQVPLYNSTCGVECYSSPVNVSLTGLKLTTAEVGSLAFHFDNGDHNMQVLLPITFELGWAK